MQRLVPSLIVAITAFLAGCASTAQVASNVKTFSSLPAVQQGAGYRFERLPSQAFEGERQGLLEGIAEQSLAKVGMRRDDATPRYSVQIGTRVLEEPSTWGDHWGGWGLPGRDYTVLGSGRLVNVPPFARPEPATYRREVSIVIRELAGGQVVYESRAAHKGLWAGDKRLLPAVFDSALSDFPNATQGVKKVEATVQLK